MKPNATSQMTMEKSLTINQVLKLSLFAKDFTGTVLITSENKSVEITDLPKLISFLLTARNKDLKVSIIGENSKFALAIIKAILSDQHHTVVPQLMASAEKGL